MWHERWPSSLLTRGRIRQMQARRSHCHLMGKRPIHLAMPQIPSRPKPHGVGEPSRDSALMRELLVSAPVQPVRVASLQALVVVERLCRSFRRLHHPLWACLQVPTRFKPAAQTSPCLGEVSSVVTTVAAVPSHSLTANCQHRPAQREMVQCRASSLIGRPAATPICTQVSRCSDTQVGPAQERALFRLHRRLQPSSRHRHKLPRARSQDLSPHREGGKLFLCHPAAAAARLL